MHTTVSVTEIRNHIHHIHRTSSHLKCMWALGTESPPSPFILHSVLLSEETHHHLLLPALFFHPTPLSVPFHSLTLEVGIKFPSLFTSLLPCHKDIFPPISQATPGLWCPEGNCKVSMLFLNVSFLSLFDFNNQWTLDSQTLEVLLQGLRTCGSQLLLIHSIYDPWPSA